jgi:hypothetical protein
MLVFASRIWDRLDPEVLAKKLKLVFQGAPYRQQESDEPRNTLLELVTAFCFANQGFTPKLTADAADVVVELPNTDLKPFAVECKRPMKTETLRKNLKALRHQIPGRYTEDVPHGIAVIGVDRILDLTRSGATARSAAAIQDAIGAEQSKIQLELLKQMAKPHTGLFPEVPLFATVLTGTVFDRAGGVPVTVVHMGLSCTGPEADPISQRYYRALQGAIPIAKRPTPSRSILVAPGHWSQWPPNLRGA